MIQGIVQNQEIDFLQIDLRVLDHLQLLVIDVKILALDIVIVMEKSIPIEVHNVQDTLKFIANEESLDLPSFWLSENNSYRSSSRYIPAIDSTLENINQIGLHQDQVHDLRLHVEDLLII